MQIQKNVYPERRSRKAESIVWNNCFSLKKLIHARKIVSSILGFALGGKKNISELVKVHLNYV